MSDKILPCPFCGCETIRVHKRTCDKDTPYNPADRAYPLVRCYGCGASAEGDDWTDIDTAINRWNRRAPAVPVMGEAVAFGSGDKIVGVGTYKNVPAVFVMPAPIVGVVGERAGDIYSKDSIIACEFVLTFPTGNQAQAVADALCNATSITQAEIDALLNAARALDALLDRELHVLDKEVVFPFESHTQAWNHIVDARQIASEAAAIAKERQS